ncbi:protein kintoun [Lissotriton helveticus]
MATNSSGDKLEDLDLSSEEVERLSRAFKDERFKELFREYAEEISNPENRRLYEQEIRMMEQDRGMDAKFVHPQPGHVLRTSLGGRQRCYVNVCSNPLMGQPECKPAQGGQQWSLPYSLSPGREDLGKGSSEKHAVYDVVFHPDTLRMAGSNPKFKEMVDSTALEGVEKQFEVTLDKRNVKTLKTKYKGVPQATVLRTPLPGVPQPPSQDPDDPLRFPYPYVKANGTSSEDKPVADRYSSKRKDPKPQASVVAPTEPHFTITHRSYVDLQDFRLSRDAVPSPVPKELLVTIDLPLLKSAGDANLDIHERLLTLESQTPAYSLRVPLPYPVDETLGSAKFNKAKRQLLVTLPVVVQKCQAFVNTSPLNAEEEDASKSKSKQLVEELNTKEGCDETIFQEPTVSAPESSQPDQSFTSETIDGEIKQAARCLGDNDNGSLGSETLIVAESEGPGLAESEGPGLAESEGPCIAESEGPCITESEGPCIAEPEGPCIAEPEGPCIAEPEGPCITESEGPGVTQTESFSIPVSGDSSVTQIPDVFGKTTEKRNVLTLAETENIVLTNNNGPRDVQILEQPREPCFTVHHKEQVPVSEEAESLCPHFQCTQDDISVTVIIHVPQINKETLKSYAGTSHYNICFTSENTRMVYSLFVRFNHGNKLKPNEVTVCIAKHNAVIQLTKASDSCGPWEKCSYGVDENNLQDWLFVTEENVDHFLDDVVNPLPPGRSVSETQPVIEVVEVTDQSSRFRIKEPVTKHSDLPSGEEQSINNAEHSTTESEVIVHLENNIATRPAEKQQTGENGEPGVSITNDDTVEKPGHGAHCCSKLEPVESSLPPPGGGRTKDPELQADAITTSKCATSCHGAKQRSPRLREQVETEELDEDDTPDAGGRAVGANSAMTPAVHEINPEDGSVHVITDHTTRCAFTFQNTLIYDLD